MASPQCLLLILLPFELYSFSKASTHTVSFPRFSDKVLIKKKSNYPGYLSKKKNLQLPWLHVKILTKKTILKKIIIWGESLS